MELTHYSASKSYLRLFVDVPVIKTFSSPSNSSKLIFHVVEVRALTNGLHHPVNQLEDTLRYGPWKEIVWLKLALIVL